MALPIQVALEHLAGLTSQHVQVLPKRLLVAAQAPRRAPNWEPTKGFEPPTRALRMLRMGPEQSISDQF